MIGAGFISDYHIEGLQAAGAQVVSIYSRTAQNAQQKAQQYGIGHHSADLQEVLQRDDVDVAVICTPDFTHEEIALAAAEAGKAIYLQKPMARSGAECRRIIDAARSAGVPLYVSFMHRYFPEIAHTRRLLQEAAFGDIYSVRQRNATGGADWATWFYSREKVGGGVVLQLGVHGIDLLRYLFGDIVAVRAVTALMKESRTLADGTVVHPDNEDFALAVYRFESGVLATHESVYNEVAGTDRFRMEIYGEAGSAWLRSERGSLAFYAPEHLQHEGWFVPDLPPEKVGYRQHRHLVQMLQGEAPDDGSAQAGLASILVAEALYRSAENGGWEPVEPVNEFEEES
jgi:predicted dehydrogenase